MIQSFQTEKKLFIFESLSVQDGLFFKPESVVVLYN